jgi:hypothetical protein
MSLLQVRLTRREQQRRRGAAASTSLTFGSCARSLVAPLAAVCSPVRGVTGRQSRDQSRGPGRFNFVSGRRGHKVTTWSKRNTSQAESVGVTVVKVGDVVVHVLDRVVAVTMGMPAGDHPSVHVVVVRVVVGVFVLVLDRQVAVRVLVAGPQREGDAGSRHWHRDDLHDGDRFVEHRPREQRADEQCGGEDDLPAGGSEVASPFHPECDRRSVSESPDRESGDDLVDLDPSRRGDDQAQDEVDGSGDGAFGEGDLFGAEWVNAGGDAVVDSPAQARADDEEASDVERDAGLPRQEDTGHANEGGGGDESPSEMLAKHDGSDRKRGDELEVQQQRPSGGGTRARPATSNAGPSAPPNSTATARGRQPARRPFAPGRCRAAWFSHRNARFRACPSMGSERPASALAKIFRESWRPPPTLGWVCIGKGAIARSHHSKPRDHLNEDDSGSQPRIASKGRDPRRARQAGFLLMHVFRVGGGT